MASATPLGIRCPLHRFNSYQYQDTPIVPKPTPIHADNQGAIAMSKSEDFHARTKHIQVRYSRPTVTLLAGTDNLAYKIENERDDSECDMIYIKWSVKLSERGRAKSRTIRLEIFPGMASLEFTS